MKENLISLFSGPLYIHEGYGISCLPTLYKGLFQEMKNPEKDELIANVKSETNSTNLTTNKKVVVLNFNQPVIKYDYGYWLGTQSYISILKSLQNNDDVAGVVLNVDSGGGQVYGTGEFYDFVKSFSKPIVTFTNGYLCSAAYYFAAATDYIVANERADAIGSIGAYATIINSNGIWEHFGAQVHTMYATKSSKKNKDYRDVIEKGDYQNYIKNQLDPIVETFHADMKSARPQLNNDVFTGDTWIGSKSNELGLIDETGSLETAIDKVFELASANSSNTNKSNNMSKEIKAPSIQNVLGYETPFQSNENGLFLQETELATIEEALTNANTNVTNITAERDTANSTIETATNSIDAALNEAEIEFTAEMTLEEKIGLLEAQRKEYANKPAGSGKTTTVNEGDEDPGGTQEQKVYAHDEEAKKILGIK